MASKQRAYLKGLAMNIDPIFQIGKFSLMPELAQAVDEALETRELTKVTVLKNCLDDDGSIADVLAERMHSQVVQVIGRKIVLCRPAREEKKRKIVLLEKQTDRHPVKVCEEGICLVKTGILGGTFNPIHSSHLWLSREAYEQFGLDAVWFMPTGNPPHKKDHKVIEGEMREHMVKLAITDTLCFPYSDFEPRRRGNTYTAQTLSLLREEYREDTFYFIIGADFLYQIEQWFHPELVMKLAVPLAAGRAYHDDHQSFDRQIEYLTARYGVKIYPVRCREMDVSSEEIRASVSNGHSIHGLVPDAVEEYIKDHGLYGGCVKNPVLADKGERMYGRPMQPDYVIQEKP